MVADKKDGQNYQNKIQPKRNQKKKKKTLTCHQRFLLNADN